ncbi:NAD-dependent epimerase/dehydratase family protein [Litorivicinus sp.]|nr:NAD-dependent epimerase/dehydratase family protein [Litorivicinus sp.]
MKPSNNITVVGGGFIGSSIFRLLSAEFQGNKIVMTKSSDLDLVEGVDPGDSLSELFSGSSTVVFSAALAPCRTKDEFSYNLSMIEPLLNVADQVEHLVYISSDAVYGDYVSPISEGSYCDPRGLHGLMHLTRERLILDTFKCPVAIVRPTLVYGVGDPHKGYGPNLFAQRIRNGEPIKLFGLGEELRDHVYVEDVARVVVELVKGRMSGVVNAVSGSPLTFAEVAELLVKLSGSNTQVKTTPRSGPMPHGGYRTFAPSAICNVVSGFRFVLPEIGFGSLVGSEN